MNQCVLYCCRQYNTHFFHTELPHNLRAHIMKIVSWWPRMCTCTSDIDSFIQTMEQLRRHKIVMSTSKADTNEKSYSLWVAFYRSYQHLFAFHTVLLWPCQILCETWTHSSVTCFSNSKNELCWESSHSLSWEAVGDGDLWREFGVDFLGGMGSGWLSRLRKWRGLWWKITLHISVQALLLWAYNGRNLVLFSPGCYE